MRRLQYSVLYRDGTIGTASVADHSAWSTNGLQYCELKKKEEGVDVYALIPIGPLDGRESLT